MIASVTAQDSVLLASQALGRGETARSVALMRAAVEAQPDSTNYYALGRCQRAALDEEGAEASYREALRLQPDYTDAWISLGILLRARQQCAESIECQRKALSLDPDNFTARLNLGNALLSAGRDAEAEAAFRATLVANSACAEAHQNLARLLVARKETTAAAKHYAAALAGNPHYFEAAQGFGELLLAAEQPEDAIAPLSLASKLKPRDTSTRRKLGHALSGAGRYSQAIAEFEGVLQTLPRDHDTRYDLALAQFYSGQYTRPRATLEDLLSHSTDPFVSLAYASLLLRAGEFRRGWPHYSARWKTQEPGKRVFPEPEWNGENLAGKTLLIAREQGLGDEIMFASIFPQLLSEAAHCIIECEERLVPLYRRTFRGATIFGVPKDDPRWTERLDAQRGALPRFDCWVPLGDLGGLRRNEPCDFPRHSGYLEPDPARVQFWREKLAATGTPVVGIGWRGGTQRSRTRERSLSLDDLKPLLFLTGIRFVSLQYGPCADEVSAFSRTHGISIDHWQESIDNIDDYAALIAALDLVVSVCSAVIHLGGALGKPVWVLAPQVPEWRYGREGERMIWYPTARLFRQDKSRTWQTPVRQVRRELASLYGRSAQ